MTTSPIRLAFIGAGLFARDAHVPSLLALGDTFTVTCVYSRTEASAQALADLLPYAVDITTDLDSVFSRDNVDAVDITLPIPMLPEMVTRALQSGKHVISEKPIAPTVAIAQPLLEIPLQDGQVWMVGENWRYETLFEQAGDVLRSGKIGTPLHFSWVLQLPVTPDNKYYHTAWRRDPAYPGGFLLDGGVHHIAAIRQVLGEVVAVQAMTTQMSADLPPADTLTAALRMADGTTGAYGVTYAGGANTLQDLTVIGTDGHLSVSRDLLSVHVGDTSQHTRSRPHGVQKELEAFAAAIHNGTPHRNTPQAALQDLAVMEALLNSAQQGQQVEVMQIS